MAAEIITTIVAGSMVTTVCGAFWEFGRLLDLLLTGSFIAKLPCPHGRLFFRIYHASEQRMLTVQQNPSVPARPSTGYFFRW